MFPTFAALEAADSGEIGCTIPSQKIEVFKELVVFGKERKNIFEIPVLSRTFFSDKWPSGGCKERLIYR